MFDLFYHEFRRYLPFAALLMAAHTAVWAFVATQQPVFEFGLAENVAMIFFTNGVGLIFGLIQYLLLRRKNYWSYLVHRPLSIGQIHTALFGVGSALIAIAVALPFFMVVVAMDVFTNEVVELRHYVYVLHILLVSLSAYSLGCFAALSANKGAILGIGLLFYMTRDGAYSAGLMLTIDFSILTMLFYLSRRACKVNLNQHFDRKRDIALAALAIQPALGVILFLSQVPLYHLPLVLFNAHPDNFTEEKLKGTLSMVYNFTPSQYVDAVTENSGYEDRDSLIKQVEFAHEGFLRTQVKPTAIPGQSFHLDTSHSMVDKNNGNRWSISHNERLLIGLDNDSGEVLGYLGKTGFIEKDQNIPPQARFETLPQIDHDLYIRTETTLYIVDFTAKVLSVKHQLPEGEKYVTHVQFDSKINLSAILSDKAIYLFDLQQMREQDEYAEPFNIVEHRQPMIEQSFIGYFAMVDGYLISYSGRHYYGHNKGGTELIYARHDGSTQWVGALEFDKVGPNPEIVTYQNNWASPVVNSYISSYIFGLMQPQQAYSYVNMDNITERHYPRSIYYMTVLMVLISLIATFVLGRKIKLSKDKLYLWCGMNLFFALPGFMAFLLMNSWWGFWRNCQSH